MPTFVSILREFYCSALIFRLFPFKPEVRPFPFVSFRWKNDFSTILTWVVCVAPESKKTKLSWSFPFGRRRMQHANERVEHCFNLFYYFFSFCVSSFWYSPNSARYNLLSSTALCVYVFNNGHIRSIHTSKLSEQFATLFGDKEFFGFSIQNSQ